MTRTKKANFSGENKEKFSGQDEVIWPATVKKLDSVLTDLEQFVINVDEAKLLQSASTLCIWIRKMHNHTGQILYIRKTEGWWNDASEVK